jgi:hypothetical protein
MIRPAETAPGPDQPIPFITPDLPTKNPLTLPDEENNIRFLLEQNLL